MKIEETMISDKKRITFHIGVHKSGTTFLQNNVFPTISQGTYLGSNPPLVKLVEASSHGDGPYLVSNENLGGRGAVDRAAMIAALDRLFNERSQIIIFFREPSQWIKSLYSQYVYMGGRKNFDRWGEGLSYLRYQELLDAARNEFDGRALFFDHEQLVRKQDEVLSAIEDFSGVQFAFSPEKISKNSNVSLKRNAMRIARCNNYAFSMLLNRSRDRASYNYKKSLHTKVVTKTNSSLNELLRRPGLKWLNNVGSEVVPQSRIDEIKNEYNDEWCRILSEIQDNQKAVIGQAI